MKTLFLFLLSCGSLFAQLNISNPFYVAPILKASASGPNAWYDVETSANATAYRGFSTEDRVQRIGAGRVTQ